MDMAAAVARAESNDMKNVELVQTGSFEADISVNFDQQECRG